MILESAVKYYISVPVLFISEYESHFFTKMERSSFRGVSHPALESSFYSVSKASQSDGCAGIMKGVSIRG